MKDAFYKYLTAESLKVTLSTASRKFSSPLIFNDPFDNYIDVKWMENPRELEVKVQKMFRDLAEDKNLDLNTLHPVTRLIVCLWRRMRPEDLDELQKELNNIYTQEQLTSTYSRLNEETRATLSDLSIFCITEEYTNLLMWSHYANEHKGGVIEFVHVKETDSPLQAAKQVIYTSSVPSFEFIDIIRNDMEIRRKIIDAFTLTKSKQWEYEKEWRVLWRLSDHAKKYDIIPFAEKEVGAVYLGCRMTEADKAEIMGIVSQKYPWASVYQAGIERGEFSLKFVKIR